MSPLKDLMRGCTSNNGTDKMILEVEKLHACDICVKGFKDPLYLMEHLRVHTGVNFQMCNDCGQVFQQHSSLEEHNLKFHSGKKKRKYVKRTKTMSLSIPLNIAIMPQTEDKPYLCNECGKRFKHLSLLKMHMMIHTGEKPFACAECGKSFRRSSNLKLHIMTHTGEKPYLCTVCGKAFKDSSHRNTHMKTHTGEKPYMCELCGKRFIQPHKLKKHVRTHTGKKPYLCSDCGHTFTESSSLKRHMMTHTGEKPHMCTGCGKRFGDRTKLKMHMRAHTAIKLHAYLRRKKALKSSSNQNVHMKTRSGGRAACTCDICSSEFTPKEYKLHKEYHTGETCITCCLCIKGFIQLEHLEQHLLSHHNQCTKAENDLGDSKFKPL